MKRFLFWSLQQQLFFIILITLAPSLLIYAWIAESHFLSALDKQFNNRLDLISQQIAGALPVMRMVTYSVADINTLIYKGDLKTMDEFNQKYQLDRLTITNPKGSVCIDSGRLLPGSLFTFFLTNTPKAQSPILYKTKAGQWMKSFMVPLDDGYHLHLSAGSQMITVVKEARWRRNLTLFLSGLLALLTSWFFIAIFSKRLSKLTQGFNLLQSGHPSPHIAVDGYDEIAFLGQAFNETVDKLNQRQINIAAEHESRLSDMKILAAGVAHEIRNPLAGISGMVDLMEREITTTASPAAAELLGRTRQEINRMNTIIKDMMAYARQPNIHLTQTTLPDILEEAAQIDRQCKLRMTRPLPQLMIDASAVKTVLRNLIINAREASGARGEIILGTRLSEKHVFIYVKDSGPGIPDQHRKNLFTPFYSSKARGSGLGLAIAKNIMNAHHGRLTFRSGQDGSIFILIFKTQGE